jgi:glycosyltransferase involved in cell wall biosynthesis
MVRASYHKLPMSVKSKLVVRSWIYTLINMNRRCQSRLHEVIVGKIGHREKDIEQLILQILEDLTMHTKKHGRARVWLALPFFGRGGAERFALNICDGLKELNPRESIVLIETDNYVQDAEIMLPPHVCRISFDSLLHASSMDKRISLFIRLLSLCGPEVLHIINSETAWKALLKHGTDITQNTKVFASIFSFQFSLDQKSTAGYAEYFLKDCIPYLTGLISDNKRFIQEAESRYNIAGQTKFFFHVLYQPVRLGRFNDTPNIARPAEYKRETVWPLAASKIRRPQVLWAGRLDPEKRPELLWEIAKSCTFADFRVYGAPVLARHFTQRPLSNLTLEGPYSTPLEWEKKYDFDALVFTSVWEGLPNVLLEAGELGIPIIAPTVGGVSELVSQSTGYPLSERPEARDYEQALRKLLNNPDETARRVMRMTRLINKRHSKEAFLKRLSLIPNYCYKKINNEFPARKIGVTSRASVSVIVPCYNQTEYLREAIQSALRAYPDNIEIIVIDDGSNAINSERQLREVEEFFPDNLKIFRQMNRGLSAARNEGLNRATGDYIQFLDADDLLAPDKIRLQVSHLEINRNIDVSICDYYLVDEQKKIFLDSTAGVGSYSLELNSFLYHWERGFVIPIHCALFRKSVLLNIRFDESVRGKEDWIFWTWLALKRIPMGYIDVRAVIYRQHGASMRRSYLKMGQAWLEAGLKIHSRLGYNDPFFLDSVVHWFYKCYRSHPVYLNEASALNISSSTDTDEGTEKKIHETKTSRRDPLLLANQILTALKPATENPNKVFISVILPVYNHYIYLADCFLSLADQGELAFEIICVDDGSTDSQVVSLMAALKDKNPRLKILRNDDSRGISEAQNRAVQSANGQFLAFLDCDDLLQSGALAQVQSVLVANPSIDYLFTDRVEITEQGKISRIARYGGYESVAFKSQESIAGDLVHAMVASHLKVIRRKSFIAIGGFNPRWSGVQDWDLALRMSLGSKFFYLPKALYRHRVHSASVTAFYSADQIWKTNQLRYEFWLQSKKPRLDGGPIKVIKIDELSTNPLLLDWIWNFEGVKVLDARGKFYINRINLLKETNSYFDRILWSDSRLPLALYGYLHNKLDLIFSPLD